MRGLIYARRYMATIITLLFFSSHGAAENCEEQNQGRTKAFLLAPCSVEEARTGCRTNTAQILFERRDRLKGEAGRLSTGIPKKLFTGPRYRRVRAFCVTLPSQRRMWPWMGQTASTCWELVLVTFVPE